MKTATRAHSFRGGKLLSVFLAFLLLFSAFPVSASAETLTETQKTGWRWPVASSNRYISRGCNAAHDGLDIGVGVGTPVFAAKAGTVIQAYTGCKNENGLTYGKKCRDLGICSPSEGEYGWRFEGYCNNDFGNGVVIQHKDGTVTQYAHMSRVDVQVGWEVSQGQMIGLSGNSGQCDGAHLHFGIAVGTNGEYWQTADCNPALPDFHITAGNTSGMAVSNGYVYDGNGVYYSFSTDNEPPVISGVFLHSDLSSRGYTISCSVSDNSGVAKVLFPTWTVNNGQDDLVWHEGTIADGKASCYIPTASHGGQTNCYYVTHIYAYDYNGNEASVQTETSANYVFVPEPDNEAPGVTNVHVSPVRPDGYYIYCYYTENTGVTSSKFPTWTEPGGQDDLIWHDGATVGAYYEGTVYTYINTSEHGNQKGCRYITHVYLYDRDGNQTVVTPERFPVLNVSVPPAGSGPYLYLQVNGRLDGTDRNDTEDYGTFDVYIDGSRVANDVTSYIGWHPEHSSYRIEDIQPTAGHSYTGVTSDCMTDVSGTIEEGLQTIRLAFETKLVSPPTAPRITMAKADGNTVQLRWTASPLTDSEDQRDYLVKIRNSGGEIVNSKLVTGTSCTVDLMPDVSPNFSAEVIARNRTAELYSSAAVKSFVVSFLLKAPASMIMLPGSTVEWLPLVQTSPSQALLTANVIWSSSDPNVAAVIGSELVAKASGSAVLTAYFESEPQNAVSFTVTVETPFYQTPTLPGQLDSIEDEAFRSCSFEVAVLPDGCTSVGAYAFADCDALRKIYIPSSVTQIGHDILRGSESAVIYCYADSTAAAYAAANGIPYALLDGDVWVPASELPEGALVTEEKWTYTKTVTETMSSPESNLSGWTQTGTGWQQSGSGTWLYTSFPEGFNTADSLYSQYNKNALSSFENANAKRVVSTPTYYCHIFWHWTRAGYVEGGGNYIICDSEYWEGVQYPNFAAFASTEDGSLTDPTGRCPGDCWYLWRGVNSDGSWWWWRFDTYQQTYTDYTLVYNYTRTTVTEEESPVEVTASDTISNVQHWVKYIAT